MDSIGHPRANNIAQSYRSIKSTSLYHIAGIKAQRIKDNSGPQEVCSEPLPLDSYLQI